MKCQIKGCKQKARWGLYYTHDGQKDWVNVCSEHDKQIGAENLKRVGGYLTGKE